MRQLLLAEFVVLGLVCGAYLQYKSFKAIGALPARSRQRGQGANRLDWVKVAECIAYAVLGIAFETVSLSNAVFY